MAQAPTSPVDPPPFAGPVDDALVGGADTLGSLQDRLLRARLGVGVTLFRALRCRHPGTAEHSFRVTVGCATWSAALGIPQDERDSLEVAALFHDIGKIGVPDSILLKPSRLTPIEAAIMEQHRQQGAEMLRGSCSLPAVLDILAATPTWFDGRRPVAGQVGEFRSAAAGDDLPRPARMLAIVDAFDAMTTPQVYRPAMPREQALAELVRQSGTQFDPQLVRSFIELRQEDLRELAQQVAGRWLQAAANDLANPLWRLEPMDAKGGLARGDDEFSRYLLDHLRDGVMFVDRWLRVTYANPAAEEISGHDARRLIGQRFSPSLLRLRSERGVALADDQCPVLRCLETNKPQLQRLVVSGPSGMHAYVEAQAAPVMDANRRLLGATLLLRDLASELSLEERCRSLHELATKDRLTLVSNRAELDRAHSVLLVAHLARGLDYSLIVADLDHFKHINDSFGHQAGDAVLRSFAAVLRESCRQGDVVGRYGGEEFVVLCHECDLSAGARMAELIRRKWADSVHPALGGQRVTASFGVAQARPGDTPDSMFHRADRALLEAKERGRNQVRLASDQEPGAAAPVEESSDRPVLIEEVLWTAGPRSFTLDKIEAFVDECGGDLHVSPRGELRFVLTQPDAQLRRFTDRAVPFHFELIPTERIETGSGGTTVVRTRIAVSVRPERERDRRRGELAVRARQLIGMLAESLMAQRDAS